MNGWLNESSNGCMCVCVCSTLSFSFYSAICYLLAHLIYELSEMNPFSFKDENIKINICTSKHNFSAIIRRRA